MANNTTYRKRKLLGVCTICGGEPHVDPVTLKKRTLCEKHMIENRQRKKKWREENPEAWQASIKKDLARRRNERRKGMFRTKRADAYIQWLYGELKRLRDLDAWGDVRP